jgi:hypothetical protein
LSDSELVCPAVAQALPGFAPEARWLRFAHAVDLWHKGPGSVAEWWHQGSRIEPVDTTNRFRTVRLGFLWRFSGVGPGCLLGLLAAVVLGASGAVNRLGVGPSLLIVAAVVLVLALPAPLSFWVRADSEGLALSRALLRRRHRWHDITGLDMTFGEDPDSDAARLTMRLRLTTTPTTGRGPLVGVLGLAPGHQLRGTEPRRASRTVRVEALPADLFGSAFRVGTNEPGTHERPRGWSGRWGTRGQS